MFLFMFIAKEEKYISIFQFFFMKAIKINVIMVKHVIHNDLLNNP